MRWGGQLVDTKAMPFLVRLPRQVHQVRQQVALARQLLRRRLLRMLPQQRVPLPRRLRYQLRVSRRRTIQHRNKMVQVGLGLSISGGSNDVLSPIIPMVAILPRI